MILIMIVVRYHISMYVVIFIVSIPIFAIEVAIIFIIHVFVLVVGVRVGLSKDTTTVVADIRSNKFNMFPSFFYFCQKLDWIYCTKNLNNTMCCINAEWYIYKSNFNNNENVSNMLRIKDQLHSLKEKKRLITWNLKKKQKNYIVTFTIYVFPSYEWNPNRLSYYLL